ncbi:unnamed protein product [Rotaria magnacalcarata]|uniref:Protein kinase domain-containing protein n=5 Tax=Rotaria magnacalcarata TaxID=392030 RepID=A0A815V2I1_9BILA|nr:unnamed protein product [Rotaria magnacalcarata]CAF2149204.1 unnamed protein product [Rotaria magnacalcarata]CAF4030459.1 unnamed protein product [Rotaria magnacalcarata]
MAAPSTSENQWYTRGCYYCHYTLPVRYQQLSHIGQGSYGTVIRAFDEEIDQWVAIKKLTRPFQSDEIAQRAYRELKLTQYLTHPDAQLLQLYHVFTPEQELENFETLYFVFNFVPLNLNQFIKRLLPIAEDHINQIIYSILRGLKYMHSAGIIHRDLKPENIGIDAQSNVTILDFGLARTVDGSEKTVYVVTRWWRAPEIIINQSKYDEKVDVWSVGCIMAELILLRPLFPGANQLTQLDAIFDVVGTPDIETLNEISNAVPLASNGGKIQKPQQDFNKLFGYKYDQTGENKISGVSPEGIDFLRSLLTFDPRRRPTVDEALKHPFLQRYRTAEDEPTKQRLMDIHQGAKHDVQEWKSIIWQMIQEFKPPSWINNKQDDDPMSSDDD